MAGSEDLIIRFKADLDEIKRGLKSVKGDAGQVGDKLVQGVKKTKKELTETQKKLREMGKFVAGLGLAAAFKNAAAELAQFNLRMAEVNTLLPKHNRITKETTEAVKNLSMQYGRNNTELAEAYYDVISAGSQDAAKSLELLEVGTKASIAGVTSTTNAIGAILSVTNAYGMESISAQEAATKLFTTVQVGRTNFDELASSIGEVVPIASSLGITLDEVGGFLAIMTRVSGSTARSTTQLNAVISAIAKPSERAKTVLAQVNKELGTQLDLSAKSLKSKGLEKFIGEILEVTSQYENQEDVLSRLFPRQEALKGLLGLQGENFKAVGKAIKEVTTNTTSLNDGVDIINDTLSQKFNITVQKSKGTLQAFADLFTPLGELAIATNNILMEFGKGFAEAFSGNFQFMNPTAVNPFGQFTPPDNVVEDLVTLKEEGVDPLRDAINGMFTDMAGGEDAEESPFQKAAREARELAEANAKLRNELNKNKPTFKEQEKLFDIVTASAETMEKRMESLSRTIATQIRSVAAKSMSQGIQFMTNALITGEMNFSAFGKSIAGIIGNMAIQIGEMAIAAGITMESIGKLTGTKAIIAGAALIAIGSIIKGFAGGGGGAPVSSIPSPVVPTGVDSVGTVSSPAQATEVVQETLEENTEDVTAIQREQRVQVVVQGDVLDSEETGLRLVEILNNEFESSNGRLVTA